MHPEYDSVPVTQLSSFCDSCLEPWVVHESGTSVKMFEDLSSNIQFQPGRTVVYVSSIYVRQDLRGTY